MGIGGCIVLRKSSQRYTYTYVCLCVWDRRSEILNEGCGKPVWICVLYIHCNLTPINLVDGLIIIMKCGCGEFKPMSLWLPDNWWVLLWFRRWWPCFDILWFFFIPIIESLKPNAATESCGSKIKHRRSISRADDCNITCQIQYFICFLYKYFFSIYF